MRRPNWDAIFQQSISGAGAIVVGVILSLVTDINSAWVIFGGVGLYFVLLFVLRSNWDRLSLLLNKNTKQREKAKYLPIINYSFRQSNDKVYMRIQSSKKNKKLLLRLDFFTPEPRWLIDEQTRYAIQEKFVNVHDKLMYWNQDLEPDTIIEISEPIARIAEDHLALLADGNGGRWDIPIPLGRYIYQFREQGKHKERNFSKMRKFIIEVKDGQFTYDEEI